MKILAIEKEVSGTTVEDFKPHLKAEVSKVWELYQAGIFRETYFRRDKPSAIQILECPSVKKAKDVLNTLPLVKEGLTSFDIIPLGPYPGFSMLFAKGTY